MALEKLKCFPRISSVGSSDNMQRSTLSHAQRTPKPCGWCSKKASTRDSARQHTLETCPVLAEIKCSHCTLQGHTKTHCPKRKQENYERRRDRKLAARVDDQAGSPIMSAKFAKSSTRSSLPSELKTQNAFACVALLSSLPAANERFECEKCGFQHSCEEVVEEHEKDCPGMRWADCDSDEEMDYDAVLKFDDDGNCTSSDFPALGQ